MEECQNRSFPLSSAGKANIVSIEQWNGGDCSPLFHIGLLSGFRRNVQHTVLIKNLLNAAVIHQLFQGSVEAADQFIAALCESKGIRLGGHGLIQHRQTLLGGQRHGHFIVHDPGIHLAGGQRGGRVIVGGKGKHLISIIHAVLLGGRAGLDGDLPTEYFTASSEGQNALTRLYDAFSASMQRIKDADFAPVIVYENGRPVEFSALPLLSYPKEECTSFSSISELLEHYYAEKNTYARIRQRSVDLRKIVQTILERDVKKYDLQLHQMKDTEKKDKYKVYGELINTYGYHVAPGSRSMEALNYYTNEMITIPLDPQLTPIENSKKYFDKYGKLKRTCEALSRLTVEVRDEIDHLESIQNALDIAQSEDDLAQIREEMMESGYIRRKGNAKKARFKSHPLHYVNPDGFHIYVGKNNFQNDELTFQFATGNDWWFHAKGRPGSHVIVKCEGRELTDATYEDAARLAAFYSKAKGQSKIEVDYLQKKNVKKPGGAKPGFVVYYTNYSMLIDADISRLTLVDE